MLEKKLISIVTPCYNEEDNIDELYQRIVTVMATLPYDYEHICMLRRIVPLARLRSLQHRISALS